MLPGYVQAVGAEEAELSEYSAMTSLVPIYWICMQVLPRYVLVVDAEEVELSDYSALTSLVQ